MVSLPELQQRYGNTWPEVERILRRTAAFLTDAVRKLPPEVRAQLDAVTPDRLTDVPEAPETQPYLRRGVRWSDVAAEIHAETPGARQ